MIQLGKVDVTRPVCCMCGDSGLSDELYQCKVCHCRSQHRYCSNQYPKDGAHEVCNWCLITLKEDSSNSTKKAVQNSSDSNSSHNRTVGSDQDHGHRKRSRKSISWKPGLHLRIAGDGNSHGNSRVKKADKSPEVSPETTPRKRIITRAALEEKLRRMKSEEMANRSIVPRQVYRNKVRRYKLLDEVSS